MADYKIKCIRKYYINFRSFLEVKIPTVINCLLSGIGYRPSWKVVGRPVLIRPGMIKRLYLGKRAGKLEIGDFFKCNNSINSNAIGLIQPCVFNVNSVDSLINIGDNVGISGSTINASTQIYVGNNVLIGSGCLITDTDSHPIEPEIRLINSDNAEFTGKSPIHIGNNVFIGARSIILKGVTIGDNSVIGAGSVVVRSIPSNCIAAGNPAKVIKRL